LINVSNLFVKIKKDLILKNITFNIEKGDVVALAGQNGAGKSTLIKSINGLIKPKSGAISVNGTIGFMPESTTPDPKLTVSEFLSYIYYLRGDSFTPDLYSKFGLVKKIDSLCGQLSKGLKQRVLLAAVFAGNPDIIILDEPSAGLDPQFQLEMIQLIKAIDKGVTVLISTHNISEIKELSEKVIILRNGEISYIGSTREGNFYEYF